MSLRLLASAEKARLVAYLTENFEMNEASLRGYAVVEWEGGQWVVSSSVLALPLRKMRIDSVGLLLARDGKTLTPTVAALQLFCEQRPSSLALSRVDAQSFIDRNAVAVNASDGLHVVFFGGRAIDLGKVNSGSLIRVRSEQV